MMLQQYDNSVKINSLKPNSFNQNNHLHFHIRMEDGSISGAKLVTDGKRCEGLVPLSYGMTEQLYVSDKSNFHERRDDRFGNRSSKGGNSAPTSPLGASHLPSVFNYGGAAETATEDAADSATSAAGDAALTVMLSEGDVIYCGTRTFLRAHCMLDISIIYHPYCRTEDGSTVLEMVCYEPENDMELPRLYVHYDNCRQRLQSTAIDAEAKRRREHFQRLNELFEPIAVYREAMLHVTGQFLLERLDVRELFGSKGVFQVALNPQMSDLSEKNIESNKFLFCPPPPTLVPHCITRHARSTAHLYSMER